MSGIVVLTEWIWEIIIANLYVGRGFVDERSVSKADATNWRARAQANWQGATSDSSFLLLIKWAPRWRCRNAS